jgi:hypothetical protein
MGFSTQTQTFLMKINLESTTFLNKYYRGVRHNNSSKETISSLVVALPLAFCLIVSQNTDAAFNASPFSSRAI